VDVQTTSTTVRAYTVRDDCIQWGGHINQRGYGVWRGKLVHRIAYEFACGPIPAGLVIDHQCRNRACVNPSHLRVVTIAVNVTENSHSFSAVNKAKTHCPKGHEYTPSNTSIRANGSRACKQCRRKILPFGA